MSASAAQILGPTVQAFAKRMISDHSSLDIKIESLAKRKGYSLRSGISITQEATQVALEPLTGHAFDKVFMEHNVSDHKDVIRSGGHRFGLRRSLPYAMLA